jgi:UDP-N-acetylmuramoyl-L-alanyl-D-glutamate--2,6-diaminopimelate ligase
MLLNIIEEAETYGADYLVLEINDIAIDKGLTNGIPFNIRALTNLIPNHNEEVYTPERYCQIKKSFFENIPGDEECTCVFGLTGSLSRDEFNELLRLNNNPKKTFGSKYICERRNADYTNLDCLLSEVPNMPLDSLDGLSMRIRVGNKTHDFFSNIILPHNALNFTSAVAILDALKIFDANSFSECIKDIKVPGREDVIKVNDRAIVIGLSIIPSLEVFKKYKNNYQTVNKIKVVIGAVGTGFVGWDKEFTSERFLNERSNFRRYAMNYVKENADFAYLTSNDNAADNPLDIALELQSYLNNEIPSVIETDRYEAIRKAIIESNPKDIIFIGGRGNRRILCDTANTVKFILDKEVVEKVLHELEWDY